MTESRLFSVMPREGGASSIPETVISTAAEYWIARSSRATTSGEPVDAIGIRSYDAVRLTRRRSRPGSPLLNHAQARYKQAHKPEQRADAGDHPIGREIGAG